MYRGYQRINNAPSQSGSALGEIAYTEIKIDGALVIIQSLADEFENGRERGGAVAGPGELYVVVVYSEDAPRRKVQTSVKTKWAL
jgi:hypothetical protein